MCVWVVLSVMSWSHSEGETAALASNKRCEANERKGCKCALLEAHVAELQTRRGQVQTPAALRACVYSHGSTEVVCGCRMFSLMSDV